jgi:hypothetical protein
MSLTCRYPLIVILLVFKIDAGVVIPAKGAAEAGNDGDLV